MAAPEWFGTEHVNINFIYILFFIYLTIIDYLIFSMVINHVLSIIFLPANSREKNI